MLLEEFCGRANERSSLMGSDIGVKQSLQNQGHYLIGAGDVFTLKRLELSVRDDHSEKISK